ncbi:hypothetical protein EYF80_006578 [Liparis tanakae]|uniref:Uncharacterized protein n=1 Tax=Liparis tanakae TaxID=230148 RepID=A0A4Z2IZ17_9TELE|nr:hypothetical protein EYF80_006578 [Liparis tanakae]
MPGEEEEEEEKKASNTTTICLQSWLCLFSQSVPAPHQSSETLGTRGQRERERDEQKERAEEESRPGGGRVEGEDGRQRESMTEPPGIPLLSGGRSLCYLVTQMEVFNFKSTDLGERLPLLSVPQQKQK